MSARESREDVRLVHGMRQVLLQPQCRSPQCGPTAAHAPLTLHHDVVLTSDFVRNRFVNLLVPFRRISAWWFGNTSQPPGSLGPNSSILSLHIIVVGAEEWVRGFLDKIGPKI
jgi:hypothetical protein